MLLHTVNHAPLSSQCLSDCLRVITAPAALLLIEDGVYGASPKHESLFVELTGDIACYALQADVEARGLVGLISPRFTLVSDAEFVELTIQCQRTQSWY
ncbi:MAG: sulfurtransferase complex subunit TusB [Halopseudomonas sp.]